MKQVVLALLAVLAVLLAPSLAWGDDSRHYNFAFPPAESEAYHAAAGGTVTAIAYPYPCRHRAGIHHAGQVCFQSCLLRLSA